MRATKFREMLRLQPFKPFLVKTTDGDTFTVEHPDFAIVSPGNTEVVIFDRDDHMRILAMKHVVTLEPVRVSAKKPGKR